MWFATNAWLRRVQRSPCPAGRHTQLAPAAPVFTPASHSSTVRSFCVRERPTRSTGAYYTDLPTYNLPGQPQPVCVKSKDLKTGMSKDSGKTEALTIAPRDKEEALITAPRDKA